jgi:hypothetical protein
MPVATPLADGQYLGIDPFVSGEQITFTLVQALRGDECAAVTESPQDDCGSGGLIVTEPSASFTIDVNSLRGASVTSDLGSPTYAVPPSLLPTLVTTGTAPGAPDGFRIQLPATFVVTIADAEVVSVDQQFRS